jgi:hypothetical protein
VKVCSKASLKATANVKFQRSFLTRNELVAKILRFALADCICGRFGFSADSGQAQFLLVR